MRLIRDQDELLHCFEGILSIEDDHVTVINGKRLKEELCDLLAFNAAFHTNHGMRRLVQWTLRATALYMHAVPASVHNLFTAPGHREFQARAVPIIHLPVLAYDAARAVFRAAREVRCTAFAFGITPQSLESTDQNPAEYASCILAAAIRESYHGPVFLFADDLSFNPQAFSKDIGEERQRLRALAQDFIEAGFFNININGATLTDQTHEQPSERQHDNISQTVAMTVAIREMQPQEVQISIGATPCQPSTSAENAEPSDVVEDFRAFLDGYALLLKREAPNLAGIGRVGGTANVMRQPPALPDGRVPAPEVNFKVLKKINDLVIGTYGLGGVYLDAGDNMSDQAIKKVTETQTIALHFSHALENIVFDRAHLADEFVTPIHEYLSDARRADREAAVTEEQFFRTARNACFGPFKKTFWTLDEKTRNQITDEFESWTAKTFNRTRVIDSKEFVHDRVRTVIVCPKQPDHDNNG